MINQPYTKHFAYGKTTQTIHKMTNNIKEIQETSCSTPNYWVVNQSGDEFKLHEITKIIGQPLTLERVLKALKNTNKDKFFKEYGFEPEFLTVNLDQELYLVDNYICDLSDLTKEDTQRAIAKLLGWGGKDE